MKKGRVIVPFIILVVITGNYFGTVSNGSIRTVEFVTVLAMGILSGVLLVQLIQLIKKSK